MLVSKQLLKFLKRALQLSHLICLLNVIIFSANMLSIVGPFFVTNKIKNKPKIILALALKFRKAKPTHFPLQTSLVTFLFTSKWPQLLIALFN
jgi:hypothetical protein